MATNLSLRAKLLGTSALAVAGTFWLGATPAVAIPTNNCVTVSGATTTITCSDDTFEPVATTTDHTTITLNPNATVSTESDPAISIYHGQSSITMGSHSSAYTYGGGRTVVLNGEGATLTLNDHASIAFQEEESSSSGAFAVYGSMETGGGITLNGGSTITFNGGSYGHKYGNRSVGGLHVFSSHEPIVLNGGSSINVNAHGSGGGGNYTGAYLISTSSTHSGVMSLTLNGASSINLTSDAEGSHSLMGVRAGTVGDDKYAPDVTLNGGSKIVLNGSTDASNTLTGIFGGSTSDDGTHAPNITLNGGSSIELNGYANGYGGTYRGISSVGLGGDITFNDASKVLITTSAHSTSASAAGVYVAGSDTDPTKVGHVTLNGGSSITIDGHGTGSASYQGLIVGGFVGAESKYGPKVTLSGGSLISVTSSADATHASLYGIVAGDKYRGSAEGPVFHGSTITLNSSAVKVMGMSSAANGKYVGVENRGDDASVILNEGSGIFVTSTGADATALGLLVSSTKYNDTSPDNNDFMGPVGTVALNSGSAIEVKTYGPSPTALGFEVIGVGANLTLGTGAHVLVAGYGGGSGSKYIGGAVGDASTDATTVGTVTLNAGSSITVQGYGNSAGKYLGLEVGATSYGGGNKYAPDVVLNDASVNVFNAAGHDNKYLGLLTFGSQTVTLNGMSSINLGGAGDGSALKYLGVVQFGKYEGLTLNGQSSIALNIQGTSGDTGYLGSAGVMQLGKYSDLTMNGSSIIRLQTRGLGDGFKYVGVEQFGEGSSVTLNDASVIRVDGYGDGYSADPDSFDNHKKYVAIFQAAGTSNSITLNGASRAEVYAHGGDAIAVGIFQNVDDSEITLNGNSLVSANGGEAGYGIIQIGDDNNLTIGSSAAVYGSTVGIVSNGQRNNLMISGHVSGYQAAVDMTNAANSTLTLNSGTARGGLFANPSDTLVFEGAGTLDAISGFTNGFHDFGDVTVNASGIWHLAAGTESEAYTVQINSGTLAVNGDLTAYDGLTVANGGTLGGSGTVTGTVTVESGGTVAPGNSPGTLHVVGPVTFNSGSIFAVQIGATAADLLDVTGPVTISPGSIIEPTFLDGADGFVGDIVTGTTVTGSFTPGSGASVTYTPGTVSLTAVSPSSMNGSISAGASSGFSFLDTVLGQAQKGMGAGKTLWATAILDQSDREGQGSARGFSQYGHGGAFGGDIMQSGDFSMGLAGGYIDSDAKTNNGGSESSIDGYNVALYGTYNMAGTYFTAGANAAYQQQDISRKVFSAGALTAAKGSPDAWLGGLGFGAGHEFPLQGAFTITPKANFVWQHLSRDGYSESGGGTGGMSIDGISTDTMRGYAGAELALNIHAPDAPWTVRPAIRAGVAQEWRQGDETASGTFHNATSGAFTVKLDQRNQTYLAVGAGVDITVGNGITAFASYDSGSGGEVEKSGGFRLGARLEW